MDYTTGWEQPYLYSNARYANRHGVRYSNEFYPYWPYETVKFIRANRRSIPEGSHRAPIFIPAFSASLQYSTYTPQWPTYMANPQVISPSGYQRNSTVQQSHETVAHEMRDDHSAIQASSPPPDSEVSTSPNPGSPRGRRRTPSSIPTRRHGFECENCHKTFDRASRAAACLNAHLALKPYVCRGECGFSGCSKSYGSIEHLKRHRKPFVRCPNCEKDVQKQTFAQHQGNCYGIK